MTIQEKKEKLFDEICAEMDSKCGRCYYNPNYGFDCDLTDCKHNDDYQTAILSLVKKENYPDLFEEV